MAFDLEPNDYAVIEQGVLFNMLVDEKSMKKSKKKLAKDAAEVAQKPLKSKKATKELNFWVVGRRKLQRINSKWINLGDFFICFHDSCEQILLEMAFDIGFGKLAI
jgi:hypothetical protein